MQELDQPVYHSGRDSSFSLTVNCNWKLAAENYCEAYHLPFIHPGLNSYSRLEDHYNIMPISAYAGQGSTVSALQLSNDGHAFPNIEGLSKQWSSGAEYVALFPNLLRVVHRDHCYGINWCLRGQILPLNILKSIMRKTRQQNQFLPICVTRILKCDAIFLSKMCLLLQACRKVVIPVNMMVANSRL